VDLCTERKVATAGFSFGETKRHHSVFDVSLSPSTSLLQSQDTVTVIDLALAKNISPIRWSPHNQLDKECGYEQLELFFISIFLRITQDEMKLNAS